MDYKGLYDTVKKLHEGREYRLRQTVQRIRDSFESEELDLLKCIEGFANMANPSTKHNPGSCKLIIKTPNSGLFYMPRQDSYTLESSECK